jgi:hypothetical protein
VRRNEYDQWLLGRSVHPVRILVDGSLLMVTPTELRELDAEDVVRASVKAHLSAAIDFNTPFAKFALQQIGGDVIGQLIMQGWRPPE